MTAAKKSVPEETLSNAGRYRLLEMRLRHGPAWRAKAALDFATRQNQSYQAFPDQQTRELVEVHRHELHGKLLPTSLADFAKTFARAREIDHNPRKKLEVDARVLARLSTAEIAVELSIEQSIVEAYERCFYDVREHLDASSMIRCFAIPPAHSEPHRSYVLSVAYSGRISVAKYVLERLDRVGKTHDLTTASGRELEQLELDMLCFSIDWHAREMTPQQCMYLHRGSHTRPACPAALPQLVQDRLASKCTEILSSADLELGCAPPAERTQNAARDAA